MKRSRPLAIATLIAASLVLSGCAAEEAAAPRAVDSSETPAAEIPSSTPTAEASGDLTQTALDISVEDPTMGDVVKITGIVRNFPHPESVDPDVGELVLINLTATASSKYYTGWGPSSTFVLDQNGVKAVPLMATSIIDSMNAAGFTAFEEFSLSAGETASGWVPYAVKTPDSPVLDFGIYHLAASVSDGTTIEEAEYTVRVAG